MTEVESSPGDAAEPAKPLPGFWDRHARLSILLIAAVFYVILLGMCITVFILLWLRN